MCFRSESGIVLLSKNPDSFVKNNFDLSSICNDNMAKFSWILIAILCI